MASTAGGVLGFVGRLAAAIGPPGIVLPLFPGWIHGHPVLTVFLVLGYEAVLLVVSFVRGVATEVEKRWQSRVTEKVDRILARVLARFDRRYRQFVLGTLRFVDTKGLATLGPYTPQLDEVFVDLDLVPRSPHLVRSNPLGEVPAEPAERGSLQDFLDQEPAQVLAVVGAAGCGKTTLLRHAAREICRPGGAGRRTVPIFLVLRDHEAQILDDPAVTLAGLIRSTLGRYGPDEPPGWFEQKLRDGDCVVLLDGLDEVTPDAGRRAISDWVERQIGQFPDNDFVITSRPRGYRAAEINGATVLQVRPLTGEQVSQFLHRWYRSMERHGKAAENGDPASRADTLVTELLDQLRNTVALRELTVNPLLLTMIANVHAYGGALPGGRAELYSEICEVMLWRRNLAKRLPAERDIKELPLRHLAFTMMERRVRDLPRDSVLEALKPLLRRVSRQHSPDRFLEEVSSSGLLIERENGLYSFAHHTFQEHLAAVHIHDKGLTKLLAGTVEDVWWRDCTLLYAARADPDAIISACLKSQSEVALALAFDCAEQARELDPGLKAQLDELLAASYQAGTEPGRRKLMARVLLTRHLRRFTPAIDAVPRVCVRPITVDIYRLFLADTGVAPPDDPRPFEPGSGGPVVGAHPADVLSFVQWANEIAGSYGSFRLPARAEAADPAVRRGIEQSKPPLRGGLSIWLKPEPAGTPQLWIPDGGPHPHALTSGVLGEHVREDLRGSVPTLPRLLLARSLVLLRAVRFDLRHGSAGDRARNAAGQLEQCLACAAELALCHAGDELTLARAVEPALQHAVQLARALTREVDNARTRDLARLQDLARTRKMEYLQALDLFASALRPEPGHVRDPDGSLAREFDYINRLVRMLDNDLDRALATHPERTLDTVLGLDRAAEIDRAPIPMSELDTHVEALLGKAFARALSLATQNSGPSREDGFPEAFAEAFVRATGIDAAEQTVSPDALVSQVRQAYADVRATADPGAWLLDAAARLEHLAVPVFGRERPMPAATATAIRVSALCMAVELEARGRSGAGLRKVAAGASLLTLRRGSTAHPTETIVLVTT